MTTNPVASVGGLNQTNPVCRLAALQTLEAVWLIPSSAAGPYCPEPCPCFGLPLAPSAEPAPP